MNRILELVQSGGFDPVKEFTGNKDELLEVKTAFENIGNNLPKEVCMNFILTKITPTVFDKSIDNTVRDGALEIGLYILQYVNVSVLNTKEQESVFNLIEESYTTVIGELRDNNYASWDKMWIFIIKLCREKLHSKLSLANKLLRVVEVAFRNSNSIDQRLKAYDCWVELINNSSLNLDHMCSAKQIKLLVTPMKAKFSRMPIVIMKRCDTFVYLLEKLQDKATLCLKEFLEFCFGPLDDKNDVEKMKQGRSVPEVCSKSTRVLLEIIGHSHNNSEECLHNDDLHLYSPLINDTNFPNFAEILINSLTQCSILLNEWSQNSCSNNTIIKCLWGSLLRFVHITHDDMKKKCYIQINHCLKKLLERSNNNEYLRVVLVNIIDLLVQDVLVDTLKDTVFDISMSILPHLSNESGSITLNNIESFIVSCFDGQNQLRFDKIACNSFKSNRCENPIMCEVWLKCKIIITLDNVCSFMWPIRHLQNFKDTKALNSKWTKLYTTDCRTDNIKVVIMQEMEKLFLENPLMSSNIIHFLELMAAGEVNPTRDFVAKFMRLIELVLTLPNLSECYVKKISSIVVTYCNQNLQFYKSENNDEVFDKICGCLEHLVTIHKDFALLAELATRLENSQPKNLAKFSRRLMSFLEALMLNEDNSIANNTRKLIELLETKENEPDVVSSTASRSMRIVSLASVSSKKRPTGQMTLSLRNTKTISSSKNYTTDNSRKKKKEPFLTSNEDNSSDYVKVDTEVKINVDNLSEHQKEVFNKRREDIPALYQDLSQSQSQDFFKSIDKETTVEVRKKLPEEHCVTKEAVSKKRKRQFDDDDNTSKTPKLCKESTVADEKEQSVAKEEENMQEADTQTQIIEEKNDLTQVSKEVTVEIIPKMSGEDLSEEASPDILANLDENVVITSAEASSDNTEQENKVLENHTVESPKSKQEEEENKVANLFPEIQKEKIEENEGSSKVEPEKKEAKNCSPEVQAGEKSSRKYQRLLKELKDHWSAELVDEAQRQNTQSSDTNQSKIENSVSEESTQSILENGDQLNEHDLNSTEDFADVPETPVRKSKRQPKKRHEYMVSFKRRKYVKRTRGKPSPSTQKEFVEDTESSVVLETPSRKRSNKQKQQQNKNNDDDDDENVTMEELLARVDRRIEENKKKEQERLMRGHEDKESEETVWESLQDGNQNKITSLLEKKSDKSRKRREVKANRRLSLPIIKTVKASESRKSLPVTDTTVTSDVYEFKGDEEAMGVVKKSRRRRKSMFFNSSDYISKRRRKSKKSSINDDLPFHVTADSPVPLSKSQSLRAVPSSQASETITILITRSPKDNEDNPEDDEGSTTSEAIPVSPRDKSGRSRSPKSEDFIESSQVSPINDSTKRRRFKSKSRSFRQTTIEEALKPLTDSPESYKRKTRNSMKDSEMELALAESLNFESPFERRTEEAPHPLKPSKARRLSLTEPLPQDTKTTRRIKRSRSLDFTETITFTFDKPSVHINDTSADTLTCGTIESFSNLQQSQEVDNRPLSPLELQTKDDLPCSPVTCETPDRNTELLNNTSDISPISTVSEMTTPTPKHPPSEVSNLRVARLLQMVNSNVHVSNEGRRWFGKKFSSPKSSRAHKMRLKKEENLDILTFSREVPSPLTVPASGILKRKFSNLEEVATPSPKRKRVNFSDPAITEKKLFIKDAEEYSDIHQNTDNTNESQTDDFMARANAVKARGFLSFFDREEALFHFKELCDSNFEDLSIDDTKTKNTLSHILQNLRVHEVVEIISEYLTNIDSEKFEEIQNAALDRGSSKALIDVFVLPLLTNEILFEDFLPKLVKVVEKFSDKRLQHFINELSAAFGEKRINDSINTALTHKQVEDHIVDLECDKMKDLIKKYILNLQSPQRNDFLVDLMSTASSELPVSKEFVNCHVNILQSFVKRMSN